MVISTYGDIGVLYKNTEKKAQYLAIFKRLLKP